MVFVSLVTEAGRKPVDLSDCLSVSSLPKLILYKYGNTVMLKNTCDCFLPVNVFL